MDKQWRLIESLTRRPDNRGAVRTHNMRDILNALLYLNKTSCQWQMLPSHFRRWKTLYDHYRGMRLGSTSREINRSLNEIRKQRKGAIKHHGIG